MRGAKVRSLVRHDPTNDQLVIIKDSDPGDILVRGAAGSGKTTTALMRLELLTNYWIARRDHEGSTEAVRVLALAFNRTLVGYMRELASTHVPAHPLVELEINTVAAFNRSVIDFHGSVWDDAGRGNFIWSLARHLGFSRQFLIDEVEYVLGRFPPDRLTDYVGSASPRLGRGQTPTVSVEVRQRILDEVIRPLIAHKKANTLVDWNDLSVLAAAQTPTAETLRQIVVVDEAQDFSVNQMRSVVTHLAPIHSLTVVTDTAQRIYPRYLYYPEAGLPPFKRIYSLGRNFRNTPAIAAVAAGILSGLTLDDDATLPSPAQTQATRGVKPALLAGSYAEQLNWTVTAIKAVDLTQETVGILTLRGGGAFNYTRKVLESEGIEYVELQKQKDWPAGPSNVAISTLHSAKGLEFDHVFILGLNEEFTEHDDGDDDATLDRWRRLLGMAVGRARQTAAIGYKPLDASKLISFVDRSLVQEIELGHENE